MPLCSTSGLLNLPKAARTRGLRLRNSALCLADRRAIWEATSKTVSNISTLTIDAASAGAFRTVSIAIDEERVICRFFFQAEDGIRDYKVTGVQTCALPI